MDTNSPLVTVTIYGQNIKNAIRDKQFSIEVKATLNSNGDIIGYTDCNPLIDFLETDYIESYLDDTTNIDTEVHNGEFETELLFYPDEPFVFTNENCYYSIK